ncbi:C45 family peptidase [Fluviicola sp.]|uniref:C45 family autoproteolytic acyltransferase/hydolase n=1 Tax=Fluviicola sp. TaxID=1917219 RepID=UPI002623353B|nr:C45 family peptidase [Fluviicola sp.]
MLRTLLKYLFRLVWIPTELVFAFVFILFTIVLFNAQIDTPEVPSIEVGERKQVGKDHYVLGSSYLKKNKFGVWEMYLEGEPYERGLIYGKLAKELVQEQEDIFVGQINNFLPNKLWRHAIKLMVGFFNSDLPENIPLENQQEIYGISQSFSERYNYIASKYTRILNYHAAHDIGHALNDYSVVGCTSFAVKGTKSENKQLLVGRNFDFYVGDDFAKNKLIIFVNPSKGYKFTSYSWAGFTGVASGMNEKGLTVTINASKSDLPTSSKMPISLLAREILQYAKNIDEAIAIAKKRHTFVSETLMISSAEDGKAVLIEKSPKKLGVYESKTDVLVCANHYQSETFKKDPENVKNIAQSDSKYRFDRMNQLLEKSNVLNPLIAASILRNQNGWDGDTLGMGNPRALNQLLAHHSVVMQPQSRLYFISSTNFQLGTYLGYDLNKTFKTKHIQLVDSIPQDAFVNSVSYQKFKDFKTVKQQISAYLMFDQALDLNEKQIATFISNNSELYITYEQLGKYFQKKGNKKRAILYYQKALTKRVASPQIEQELKNLIKECQK